MKEGVHMFLLQRNKFYYPTNVISVQYEFNVKKFILGDVFFKVVISALWKYRWRFAISIAILIFALLYLH